MPPSPLAPLNRIPGARAAWRSIRGRPAKARAWLESRAESVREGVRVAIDPEWARAYGRGGGTKPTWRRVAENAAWALRYGAPNKFYYAYGMDTKGGADYDRYRFAQDLRGHFYRRNRQHAGETYFTAVLEDKYFFSLVAQTLGHRTPRVLAMLLPDHVDLLAPRRSLSYEEFVSQSPPVDGFAKVVRGLQGRGAFTLRIEDGELWIDDAPASPADVAARVAGRFLLQERVVQHPTLAALHPSSVNTIRLVTVLRDGRATPLAANLRIGVGGGPVDNWSAGGLVVRIDLETGALSGRGVLSPTVAGRGGLEGLADRHPDTGIDIDGYTLPYVPQALDLACRFHVDLGGPPTIGWDLALTPTGPCVVEGNSNWGADQHLVVDPGFKDRFGEAVGWLP